MDSYPVGFDRLPHGFDTHIHPLARRPLDDGTVLAYRLDIHQRGDLIQADPSVGVAVQDGAGVRWLHRIDDLMAHDAQTPGIVAALVALRQEQHRLNLRDAMISWTQAPGYGGYDDIHAHLFVLPSGFVFALEAVEELYSHQIDELCDPNPHWGILDHLPIVPAIATVLLPIASIPSSAHEVVALQHRSREVFDAWRHVSTWASEKGRALPLSAPDPDDVRRVAMGQRRL